MSAWRKIAAAIARLWRGRPLETFAALARRRRPAPTSRLYVIETDGPFDEKARAEMDAALEPLRAKFGLDFFVLEPGFKLMRWDDY